MIHRTYASLFQSQIFVGLRNTATNYVYSINRLKKLVDNCCKDLNICVTITETEFFYPSDNPYKKRHEPGVIIGIINYPRFPESRNSLIDKTDCIAFYLMDCLYQCRVTYTTPEGCCMLSNPEQIKKVMEKESQKDGTPPKRSKK